MVLVSEGFGAVAVAPQVRGNDREVLGQTGCHQVPHRVGLRVAVEEQHGRSITPADKFISAPLVVYPLPLESLEQLAPFRWVVFVYSGLQPKNVSTSL